MERPDPIQFHVAPTSGVPIYRQLVDQVRARRATGRLTPGDFLPSVRQVAGELAINPMTVSKAYSLLEREGVLEHVRGQGMRVAEPAGAGRTSPPPLRAKSARVVELVRQLVRAARAAGMPPDEIRALLDTVFTETADDRTSAASR